jgi:hypothetical protein
MDIDERIIPELLQAFGEDIAREVLGKYFRNFASVPDSQDRQWRFAGAQVDSLDLDD